jgi:muramoyltetrapeptide carboxypeptidase LdcA involved in peptidoglycan recycling
MKFTKPLRLKKGDTVAIVSQSWGGPSVCPAVYESGLEAIRNLGLKIKEYPSARADPEYLYNNPKFRAEDINKAFSDKEVKAIFSSIGGDDSVRVLPYLNEDVIKANPKIFMGFSDATTINVYLNLLGLVSFNGPSVMAGFSQWESLGDKFHEHVKNILFGDLEEYEYKPFNTYSSGYPKWGKKENVGKTNPMIENPGWDWLQGSAKAEGRLFGGAIEVLEFLKGTEYAPSTDFWDNKVFFLETSEDKPSPDQIKWMLRNYGMQGVFDKISALLVGRARDYTDEEKLKLNEVILQVVNGEFGNEEIPIVTNLDFGHTDPQWILPLGVKAKVDCERDSFKVFFGE